MIHFTLGGRNTKMPAKIIVIDNKITCKGCKETKELIHFQYRKDTNSYRGFCRSCDRGSTFSLKEKTLKIDQLLNDGFIKCIGCKEVKSITDYFSDASRKRGFSQRCKACDTERAKYPRKVHQLFALYGLTIEDHIKMIDNQSNKCLICSIDFATLNSKHVHVDHCHETGKIRGILCKNCNHGIGNFKDNLLFLQNAITYLTISNNDN